MLAASSSSTAPRPPPPPPPPLPVSITVRNLFPPLALPTEDNASTSINATTVDGNDDRDVVVEAYSPAKKSEAEDMTLSEGGSPSRQLQHHQQRQQQQQQQRKIKYLASKLSSSTLVEERCALVSREVLLRVRLDIVVTKKEKKEEEGSRLEGGGGEETILYSLTQSHCTAHPRWDHVNERISASRLNLKNATEDGELYARFVILNEEDGDIFHGDDLSSVDAQRQQQPQHDGHDVGAESTSRKKEWILAEVPLHPSHLRRLPLSNNDSNNIDDENNDDNNRKNSASMIIPNSLPPNTILLHFDDGYTRVLPNVYWTLVQKGIVGESVMDPIKRGGSGGFTSKGEDGDGTQSTFEEKAFDALGHSDEGEVATHESHATDKMEQEEDGKEKSSNIAKKSVYHDDDKVFDLLGEPTTTSEAQGIVAQSTLSATKSGEDSIFDDRILNLVGTSSTDAAVDDAAHVQEGALSMAVSVGVAVTTEDVKEEEEENIQQLPPPMDAATKDVVSNNYDSMIHSEGKEEDNDTHNPKPLSPSSQPQTVQTVQEEDVLPSLPPTIASSLLSENERKFTQSDMEELRQLVHLEEQLLKEEQERIIQGTNHLKSIIHQVQQLENETLEFMKAVGVERSNLFRSEFRLEAHRIHLLQHLQLIFPIRLVPITITVNPPNYPQHQYTIAGIPLPEDVHDPTVTDDQISTALGFVCHLVMLTSKYLAIPLRYTLVCKFSRSAVLFDRIVGGGSNRDHQYHRGSNVVDAGGGNNNKAPLASSKVVYPLFRERGAIDREQLDYGMMLLERNVHCMLRTRGVTFHADWNLLAKLDKLLMQVIEGEDPSFGGDAG